MAKQKQKHAMWVEHSNYNYECTMIFKAKEENLGIINYKFKDMEQAMEKARELYILVNTYNAKNGLGMVDIYVIQKEKMIYNSEKED